MVGIFVKENMGILVNIAVIRMRLILIFTNIVFAIGSMGKFILSLLAGEKWWVRWIAGLLVITVILTKFYYTTTLKVEAHDKDIIQLKEAIPEIQKSLSKIEGYLSAYKRR